MLRGSGNPVVQVTMHSGSDFVEVEATSFTECCVSIDILRLTDSRVRKTKDTLCWNQLLNERVHSFVKWLEMHQRGLKVRTVRSK